MGAKLSGAFLSHRGKSRKAAKVRYLPKILLLSRRQLYASLLILCLFGPLALSQWGLHWQRKQVRKAVKQTIVAGLSDADLVQFRFSRGQAAALDWEHSHEFSYRGQMYDVVRSEARGDSLFYWCWWDRAETALNRQLRQLSALAWGQNPDLPQREAHFWQFLRSLSTPASGWTLKAPWPVPLVFNTYYHSSASRLANTPPAPPPWL